MWQLPLGQFVPESWSLPAILDSMPLCHVIILFIAFMFLFTHLPAWYVIISYSSKKTQIGLDLMMGGGLLGRVSLCVCV